MRHAAVGGGGGEFLRLTGQQGYFIASFSPYQMYIWEDFKLISHLFSLSVLQTYLSPQHRKDINDSWTRSVLPVCWTEHRTSTNCHLCNVRPLHSLAEHMRGSLRTTSRGTSFAAHVPNSSPLLWSMKADHGQPANSPHLLSMRQ
jgi:hypothetical protein